EQVLRGADVDGEGRRVGAIEADAVAVGRDGEVLGPVAAVDLDGVDAVAAFVEVAAIAGIPDHAVVAGPAEHLVVSCAANQLIVTPFSLQSIVAGWAGGHVVAEPADQGVVAVTAEQVGRRQRPVGLIQQDLVVATLTEDLDQRGIGHRGCAPLDRYNATVDEDLPRNIPADDDGVVLVIADDGQYAQV